MLHKCNDTEDKNTGGEDYGANDRESSDGEKEYLRGQWRRKRKQELLPALVCVSIRSGWFGSHHKRQE